MQQEQITTRRAKGAKQHHEQPHTALNGVEDSRPSAVPAPKTSLSKDIVLYYSTGWSQAKLHGSINAGQWQDLDFEQVLMSVLNLSHATSVQDTAVVQASLTAVFEAYLTSVIQVSWTSIFQPL